MEVQHYWFSHKNMLSCAAWGKASSLRMEWAKKWWLCQVDYVFLVCFCYWGLKRLSFRINLLSFGLLWSDSGRGASTWILTRVSVGKWSSDGGSVCPSVILQSKQSAVCSAMTLESDFCHQSENGSCGPSPVMLFNWCCEKWPKQKGRTIIWGNFLRR